MSDFTFTRVSIIQALPASEFESGTELSGYISGLREDFPLVPDVDLINVASKEEFLQEINNLISVCEQKGEQPILHIEIHGWDDRSGLAFPDMSSLQWCDLAEPLARLNRSTGFNLVVCVAACFGAHFLGCLHPTDRSPCFALIGPTLETDGSELLGSFRSFYRELLTTLDADAALKALHAHRLNEGGFLTITAEDWFYKLANGYLRTDCTKERLVERSAKIQDEMRASGQTLTPADIKKVDQMGRSLAVNFLDRSFETYFMTEDIEGNAQRFSPSLEKTRRDVSEFFESQGY